ncbi:MAG: RNA polymerase sigma factor [Candidatus Pacebacteria bacterium]|nr:RNA polymerase sigma factor [Candidatus Paceibacterota bacterium]
MLEIEDTDNKKDEEIVLYVLKSTDYFEIIISRYKIKLKRYIERISNIPQDDVDDLIQDIFLSVYENLNSFNTNLSFSSWIYRIAHNKTINFWKKYQISLENINLEDNLHLVESIFNENMVEIDLINIENKEIVSKILENMDKKYKEVLILKFLEEKDYQEISDILQKPMGTIAALINRAKKKFKDEMEKDLKNKKI